MVLSFLLVAGGTIAWLDASCTRVGPASGNKAIGPWRAGYAVPSQGRGF